MGRIRFDQNSPMFQESSIIDGAGAASITVDTEESWYQTHWYVGVDFFTDAALTIPVDATTGSFTITVRTSVSNEPARITNGDNIVASDPGRTASFAANADRVFLTFVGVDVGIFARVRVTGNTT